MAKPILFEELDFKLTASMENNNAIPEPETPFRIALLGNYSGSAHSKSSSVKTVRPIKIDRDNIDEIIARLNVSTYLSLDDGGRALSISFEELDDFHPDQLYNSLDVFQSLRNIRNRLNDPASYESAASEVKSWFQQPPDRKPPKEKEPAQPVSPSPSSAGLLDQIVSEATGEPIEKATDTPPESELASFLHQIVDPHLIPAEDPMKEELLATVDLVVSELMSAILHHPEFQTIESAWRSVNFLVRRLETGADLEIFLLDISKDDLRADLTSSDNMRDTFFFTTFVEQSVETVGGEPWALIVGDYYFDHSLEDIDLLGRIAQISSLGTAPFISGALDSVLGCESLASTPDPATWQDLQTSDAKRAWKTLRSIPQSSSIGLTLPRFLLRLPYGEDTDPIDMFHFEEMPSIPDHYDYLWGNPAIICSYLLGSSFSHSGWDMRSAMLQDIENLPLHMFKVDGETKIKPCAEVMMPERVAATIMDKGFMPLLSFLKQDRIRLGRFQSIADPPTQLSGLWNKS